MSARPVPQTLADARAALAGVRCWVVSDGKAGDLNQCLGVAEQLGLTPDSRIVAPRAPWRWFMPRLWQFDIGIDPKEAPGREGGPLEGPLPALVIGSGRRAASSLAAIKRASGGKSFTAFLKDPRTAPAIADFIWVPQHDALRGENVMTTLLSPHRLSPGKLAVAGASLRSEIASLPRPRIAVLVGGNSRDFTFSRFDSVRLTADLAHLAREGATLMITPSRRTPEDLKAALIGLVAEEGGYWWDGETPNPYFELLAAADAIVVTADSVNMVGEALVTGKPVMVFRPSGGGRKIDEFLRGLTAAKLIRPFAGRLERYSYAPQDPTPAIALALAQAYCTFRSELKT